GGGIPDRQVPLGGGLLEVGARGADGEIPQRAGLPHPRGAGPGERRPPCAAGRGGAGLGGGAAGRHRADRLGDERGAGRLAGQGGTADAELARPGAAGGSGEVAVSSYGDTTGRVAILTMLLASPALAQEAGWHYSPLPGEGDRAALGCAYGANAQSYSCLAVRCEDDLSVGLHIHTSRADGDAGQWVLEFDKEGERLPVTAVADGSPYHA